LPSPPCTLEAIAPCFNKYNSLGIFIVIFPPDELFAIVIIPLISVKTILSACILISPAFPALSSVLYDAPEIPPP